MAVYAGKPALPARGLFTSLGLVLLLIMGGCGGGGSSGSAGTHVTLPASSASLTDTNVALVEVRQGPLDNVNMPYVSVTVCLPGSVASSTNCRTIDNVLLDTGSTGLRLFAGAVSGLALPQQTVTGVGTVYECAQFVTTLALGKVHLADISIGGEKASSLPVQLMDSSFTLAPTSRCGQAPILAAATDSSRNLQGLGANGILGVSHFINDGQSYFSCATFSPGCALVGMATGKQVQNPVTRFTSGNNNGVVVQLAPLPSASGVASVQGYLIFGVETRTNNRLGSAKVVPMNTTGNYFTTNYKGQAYDSSIFDSGSNGLFFDDADIPLCGGTFSDFYCPAGTLKLSASLPVLNSAPVAVDFSVANASNLFTSRNASSTFVFDNLSAPITNPVQPANISPFFIWGLPFYLGRSVYTVIEGSQINSSLSGPLNAFSN